MRNLLGSAGAILLLGLAVSPVAASAYVRADILDENYLVGFLFWENGKGGISWDAPRAAEDNAGSGKTEARTVDEFVSKPVPRDVYINVSRLIQLDVFIKERFYQLDVEIYAGSTFLTGGLNGNPALINYCRAEQESNGSYHAQHGCAPPSWKPGAEGYGVATHRMHSEMEFIPRGSTITLKLIHDQSNVDYSYGLSSGHASVLRIPGFSADETFYRIPKYANAPSPNQVGGVPVVPGAVERVRDLLPGGVAMLGLAAFGIRGRQASRSGTALLALVLLLAAGLAGCAGKPSPSGGPDTGPGPALGGSASFYVADDPENLTGAANSTRGSIFGVATDASDALPVAGAYVILLGTPNSARTDGYGRFRFLEVEPGTYTLRVDREGFKSLETKVEVRSSKVTRVSAVLEFVNPEDRDHRPHRHNAWIDRQTGEPVESMTVFDGKISESQWAMPPQIHIVPGTADVEITLTYFAPGQTTPSPHAQNVALTVSPPNDPRNATTLFPRPTGSPFHVRTTWETTDPGHALFTYWGLFIFSVNIAPNPCGVNPLCTPSRFHLTVTLHKGVLPLEPAHPDRWLSETRLPVLENQPGKIGSNCGAVPCLPFAPGATSDRVYNASWQPQGFVPFETEWLSVTLRSDRGLLGSGSDAPWTFVYRDASTPNYRLCDPWQYWNADAGRSVPPSSKGPTNRVWTWIVPLDGGTDPPYAPLSNWCFFVAPSDHNSFLLDDQDPTTERPILTLSITAHKGPAPS